MSSLRFGVVADPQFADIEFGRRRDRDYRESLNKLRGAIEDFNKRDLDFVIYLGDLVDRSADDAPVVLEEIGKCKARNVIVLGNHDTMAFRNDVKEVCKAYGLTTPYYSFCLKGYRLIVLDTNEGINENILANMEEIVQEEVKSREEATWMERNLSNNHFWNGSVGFRQQEWLKMELAAAKEAGELVIVFGHDPVFPIVSDSLQNSREILDILFEYRDNLVGYFAGHHHYGMYAEYFFKPFVTYKGMIMKGETAYSVVNVDGYDFVSEGIGVENSYEFRERKDSELI